MVTETQTQLPQIPEQRENPWREVPPSEEVRTYEEQVGAAEQQFPVVEVGEQDLVTQALVDRLQQKLAQQAEEKRLRSQVPATRPSRDLRELNKK